MRRDEYRKVDGIGYADPIRPDRTPQIGEASVRRSGTGKAAALGYADLIYAALTLLSLAPLFLVRYPLCVDYLNHLARLFVLSASPSAAIHHAYAADWHLIPDLGVEMLGLPLMQVLGPETAMKCVLGVSIAGIAAGVWLVHRALHGRTRPTIILAALLLYNTALSIGLLCYTTGICVMLLATAYWLHGGERPSPARLLLFNVLAGVTLCCHGAAWGALAVTVAGLHIFPLPRRGGPGLALRRLGTVAQGFVLSAAIWAGIALTRSPEQFPPSGFGYGAGTTDLVPILVHKLALLNLTVASGHHVLDTVIAAALCAGVFLAIYGARHPILAKAKWALALWGITLLLVPWRIGLSGYLDSRLTLPAALLFVCALAPEAWPRSRTVAFSAIVAAVVCARICIVIPDWLRYDAGVAGFRALAPSVTRSAKVLMMIPQTKRNCRNWELWPQYVRHIPPLLTIDRNAFVSTVFASPNMQPIVPAAGMPALSPENAIIREWPPKQGAPEVVRIQMHEFDYLAVRHLRCDETLTPRKDLTRIGDSPYYTLYRIRHPGRI